MNRSVLNYVVTAAGLLLLGVGLYLIKVFQFPRK